MVCLQHQHQPERSAQGHFGLCVSLQRTSSLSKPSPFLQVVLSSSPLFTATTGSSFPLQTEERLLSNKGENKIHPLVPNVSEVHAVLSLTPADVPGALLSPHTGYHQLCCSPFISFYFICSIVAPVFKLKEWSSLRGQKKALGKWCVELRAGQ